MIPHSRPTVVPGMEEAAARIIASGQHAGGRERRAFEDELATFCEQPHALCVQSGSAALHLALLTLGVRAGSRVIAPSYACAALLNAIDAVGATALLADIDPECLSVSSETARAALVRESVDEAEVAAAIVPHMLGLPAPVDRWDLPIPLVEDAAMALGVRVGGKPVGEFGEIAVLSFYATKMLSTGQGGAVVMTGDGFADDARDRIRYDGRESYRPSWNYPLSDLCAAIGRPQLSHVPDWIARRREIAARYQARAESAGVARAPLPEGACAYRFLIELSDRAAREEAIARFDLHAIETKPAVFHPLHRYLDLSDHDFPTTTAVWDRTLSVPLYPSLTEEEISAVEEGISRLG